MTHILEDVTGAGQTQVYPIQWQKKLVLRWWPGQEPGALALARGGRTGSQDPIGHFIL